MQTRHGSHCHALCTFTNCSHGLSCAQHVHALTLHIPRGASNGANTRVMSTMLQGFRGGRVACACPFISHAQARVHTHKQAHHCRYLARKKARTKRTALSMYRLCLPKLDMWIHMSICVYVLTGRYLARQKARAERAAEDAADAGEVGPDGAAPAAAAAGGADGPAAPEPYAAEVGKGHASMGCAVCAYGVQMRGCTIHGARVGACGKASASDGVLGFSSVYQDCNVLTSMPIQCEPDMHAQIACVA